MSCTITMPSALDESIRACCVEAVAQAVAALAAKYGFDAAEAELLAAAENNPHLFVSAFPVSGFLTGAYMCRFRSVLHRDHL